MADEALGEGVIVKHNLEDVWAGGQEFAEKTTVAIVEEAARLKAQAATRLKQPEAVKPDLKERFQVTWFDDVDKSPAKQWIVKDVIGNGDFSLWVAKPGTAKSVLLCDIGCHIAAGRDWHGRKVSQGLVVFFAAERKSLTERRIAAWRKTHDVTGIPFAVVRATPPSL